MFTRGGAAGPLRSAPSRRVDVGAAFVGAVMVAMLVPPWLTALGLSALDGDLLGGSLGSADELHAEDAVGVSRLRLVRIQPLAQAHGAREAAQRALAPVVALLGNLRLGLALAPDGDGVADDADVEASPLHARAQSLGGDCLVLARKVHWRVLAGKRPAAGRREIREEMLHRLLQAAHLLPRVPVRLGVHVDDLPLSQIVCWLSALGVVDVGRSLPDSSKTDARPSSPASTRKSCPSWIRQAACG